ncbi:MAG: DUF4129 domain-containing protein, partial [Aeromicrobium sp.]
DPEGPKDGENDPVPREERGEGSSTASDEASSSGTAPRTLLVSGIVVMVLVAAPAVMREIRRRRRLRSGSPEFLWREIEDVSRDLDLDVPDTDTPRGLAARLGDRPGVDADALERLLHRVEVARFARESAREVDPEALRDTIDLTEALRAGSARPDRWRARLLPRSLGPRPLAARPSDVEHAPV